MVASLGSTIRLGYLESTGHYDKRSLAWEQKYRPRSAVEERAAVAADVQSPGATEAPAGAEEGEPEAAPLVWTLVPRRDVRKEGNVLCHVSTPATEGQRHHAAHLDRTVRIEPNAAPTKPPPIPGRSRTQITVTEKDLRRCGANLKLLRECNVQPHSRDTTPEPGQFELSFKSAFDRRCRADVELRDPWKAHKNPEDMRDMSEQDLVLNQVWFKALSPRRLEQDPDAVFERRESPVKQRRHTTSVRSNSADEAARASWAEARSGSQESWRLGRRCSSALRKSKTSDARCNSCPRTSLHRAGMVAGRVASGVRSGSTDPETSNRATRKVESRIQLVASSPEDGEEGASQCVGSMAAREAARHGHRLERHLNEHSWRDNKPQFVWLMLDPQTGDLHPYPREVATRIQTARTQGRRSVPLAGFDGFDGDIVHFGNDFETEPITVKTLDGRLLDVCSVKVPPDAQEVYVHVAWENAWRISKAAAPGKTEERRVPVSGAEVVRAVSPTMPPINHDRRLHYINPAIQN